LSGSDKIIGVIASTPVDTQMRVDFVRKKGLEAVGILAASSPDEQKRLVILTTNTQSLNTIEKIFYENNPAIQTFSWITMQRNLKKN